MRHTVIAFIPENRIIHGAVQVDTPRLLRMTIIHDPSECKLSDNPNESKIVKVRIVKSTDFLERLNHVRLLEKQGVEPAIDCKLDPASFYSNGSGYDGASSLGIKADSTITKYFS